MTMRETFGHLVNTAKRMVAAEDAVAGMDEVEMTTEQWKERESAWSEFREALASAEAAL